MLLFQQLHALLVGIVPLCLESSPKEKRRALLGTGVRMKWHVNKVPKI